MGQYTRPSREFHEIPLVMSHIAEAGRVVAANAESAFRNEMADRLCTGSADIDFGQMESSPPLEFDSPLEVIFWVWWMAARAMDVIVRDVFYGRRHVEVMLGTKQYVLDFVLDLSRRSRSKLSDWPLIGVELDGHAFHEKTPEQVAYRNARDRALQQAGWQIFHYSYTEFTQKPEDCIWEVIEHARFQYWDRVAGQQNNAASTSSVNAGRSDDPSTAGPL